MSRFRLLALRSGPPDLYAALPVLGDTIGIRTTSSGRTVYYAVLDEPLRDRGADPDRFSPARCGEDSGGRFVWVSDIVLRPSTPGTAPHFGMQAFPVEIAYVLDPNMRGSDTIDADSLEFVAAGIIDDIDSGSPAPDSSDPAWQTSDDDVTNEALNDVIAVDSAIPPTPVVDLPPLADELESDGQERVRVAASTATPATEPRRPLIDLPPLADELEDGGDAALILPVAKAVSQPQIAAPPPPSVKGGREGSLAGQADSRHSPGVELRRNSPVGQIIRATAASAHRSEPVTPPESSAPPAHTESPPTKQPIDLGGRPAGERGKRRGVVLAAAGLAGAVLIGLIVWASGDRRSGQSAPAEQTSSPVETRSSSPPSVASTPRLAAPVAKPEEVLRLVPAGYPERACRPEDAVPAGVLGAVTCGPNTDPGGPRASRYTLMADMAALRSQFDQIVSSTRQQTCPGRIQSPGPWKRNATPERVEGMLYCGVRGDGTPVIAWTDDKRLLLSVVDSAPSAEGATFDWWSSHS